MNNTVLIKTYPHFPFNKSEILGFAGVKNASEEISNLLGECLKEAETAFTYKVCYTQCNIEFEQDIIDFGIFKTSSKSLNRHLKDCKKAIIFGATVGLGIDKLITRYNNISPSKSLIFDALGAERIEGLCDLFCGEIKEECEKNHLATTHRFSAGYGDFPLDFQKDFFRILECHKKIGLTLNDSLIMSPSKSVTGVVGLKPKE